MSQSDSTQPCVDAFDTYMQPILDKEGRGVLTNQKADRGGVTIWGITEAQARAAGYAGPMAGMTKSTALSIYRVFFWTQPGFDLIEPLFPELSRYLLDIGINCGPVTAGKMLQRSLNGLNNQGSFYHDLTVDGHCGLLTRLALSSYRALRPAPQGDAVLMGLMRALATVRYLEIAEADPTQEQFDYGWIANRALG